MATPTGIALKVTGKDGHVSYPAYEAFGWDKINAVIQGTLDIEHVAKVEIVDINIKAGV
jgi:hypothetical protein